jgi:hypothetical protein
VTYRDLPLVVGVGAVLAIAAAAVVRHLADWNLRPSTEVSLVGLPAEPMVITISADTSEFIEAMAGLEDTFDQLAEGIEVTPYLDDEIARTVRRVHFDLIDGGML